MGLAVRRFCVIVRAEWTESLASCCGVRFDTGRYVRGLAVLG